MNCISQVRIPDLEVMFDGTVRCVYDAKHRGLLHVVAIKPWKPLATCVVRDIYMPVPKKADRRMKTCLGQHGQAASPPTLMLPVPQLPLDAW